MSAIGTLPLLILLAGLLGGAMASWLVMRRRESPDPQADLRLRIADLEAQRAELYTKLRGEEGGTLAAADREALEVAAAGTLRDLDDARRRLGGKTATGSSRPTAIPTAVPTAIPKGTAAPTVSGNAIARHPLAAGVLLGGGMVALVAVLIVWAQQDALPRPEAAPTAGASASPGGSASPSGTGDFDRGQPPLPPQIAEQVEALRARLATAPEDLAVRRDLADLLLSHGQYFDAFGEAQAILARAPEDPPATYVLAVVRYTMGQPEGALELLDRAAALDPTFSQASLVSGIIRLQLGDREGAVASWQQGLAGAGGSESRLERLLELAREGRSAEEILASPPG